MVTGFLGRMPRTGDAATASTGEQKRAPGSTHDVEGKRRAQTLEERSTRRRLGSLARRQRQALLGDTAAHGGAVYGACDVGPPPAASSDGPGGQGVTESPVQTGGALVATPDGGLGLFPESMPHTHACVACGKTGTCSYWALKHAARPGMPLPVRMMGHECPVADKYVLFKVSADMMPGAEAQFVLNCQAARERRAQLEAPAGGAGGLQTALAPMPHTHQCGQCGKTGTCNWLASKHPSPFPGVVGRSVLMSAHHCAAAGKSVRLRCIADLVPGMEGQFDQNCQAARARRELLESRPV